MCLIFSNLKISGTCFSLLKHRLSFCGMKCPIFLCDYFSSFLFFFFSATYFSLRRFHAMVLKFCTEEIVNNNKKIRFLVKRNWGNPPLPPRVVLLGFSPRARESLTCTCMWGFHAHSTITTQ